MNNKPTERMVWRLDKMGFSKADIDAMTYESASKIIGAAVITEPGTKPKTIYSPKSEYVENTKVDGRWPVKQPFNKPTYNPSSQYVSYAKDIFLDLRKMIHDNPEIPKTEIITDEVIMRRSCELVDIAVQHFNK